jgi:hypothetical protein
MEFEQKKLAIEQGLTPFLGGEPLANALRLWEAKYSRGHTFALTGFISELGDGAALAAPPAKVLQSLFRALNNPPASLPAHRDRAASTTEAQGSPGHAIHTCTLLVDTMIDRLPPDKGEEIRRYMLDHLERLPQPTPVLNAIRAWLGQRRTIVLPIPETALTRLVNLAYVGLCEYVGPIKADRVLHEAVLMVETANAGSGFPVRRLL